MTESSENKLKAIFISAFVAYSVVVTLVGISAILMKADRSIWLGVTLSAAMVVFYFARLHLVRVPRTSPGLMGFTFSIFGTTMYSIFKSYDQQTASVAPLLGMICLAGWAGYVIWYSEMGDRSKEKIKAGKRLPTIALEDCDGKRVTSDDWKGQKRLVVFYRGNWCPICTAQVWELSKYGSRFEEMGVQITFVSPQPRDKSRALAERVGGKGTFLIDVDNRAAKTLGIVQENGLPAGYEAMGYGKDVPKPTTFLLDENGKVIFCDPTANYRLRPLPQDMLSFIEKLQP